MKRMFQGTGTNVFSVILSSKPFLLFSSLFALFPSDSYLLIKQFFKLDFILFYRKLEFKKKINPKKRLRYHINYS